MLIRTVFVFNTGSSSVKISLLAPFFLANSSSTHKNIVEKDEHETSWFSNTTSTSTSSNPIRILTAHAERIGTPDSFVHISISSILIKRILHEDGHKNDTDSPKFLNREDSLDHTSRMASKDHIDTTKELNTTLPKENHKEGKSIIKIQIKNKPNMTHEDAIRTIIEEINNYSKGILSTVVAVGHRVVHGGSLSDAVVVDDEVMKTICDISYLAPLHNPKNLIGIRIGKEIFKDIPQIAVFDTAFHTTIPEYAYTYAIPKEYREVKIRKYGFHGTSVKYVTKIALERLKHIGCLSLNDEAKRCTDSKLIIAHLGNGASVTAVVNGKSVDTTMEFTPLSGLMMGTRSGSIDPAVVTFASSQLNKSGEEVINDLNTRSGLLSISNGDSDMRSIERRASMGDKDANLALDMFVYIVAKHIASMIVACGGRINALVFTAGIGENSALVRKKTIDLLQNVIGSTLGKKSILDATLNVQNGKFSSGIISHITKNERDEMQPLVVMVVHTDEESGIYEECTRLCDCY